MEISKKFKLNDEEINTLNEIFRIYKAEIIIIEDSDGSNFYLEDCEDGEHYEVDGGLEIALELIEADDAELFKEYCDRETIETFKHMLEQVNIKTNIL